MKRKTVFALVAIATLCLSLAYATLIITKDYRNHGNISTTSGLELYETDGTTLVTEIYWGNLTRDSHNTRNYWLNNTGNIKTFVIWGITWIKPIPPDGFTFNMTHGNFYKFDEAGRNEIPPSGKMDIQLTLDIDSGVSPQEFEFTLYIYGYDVATPFP